MVDAIGIDARVDVTVDAMVEELHYNQLKKLSYTITK